MDKTIDFSSLKSEITADEVIDLARKHNNNETLNETLRRKGDSNISSLGIPDEPYPRTISVEPKNSGVSLSL